MIFSGLAAAVVTFGVVAGGWLTRLSSFWIYLKYLIPFLLYELFKVLGLGFVSYTGINIIFDNVRDLIVANFGRLSADVLAILSIAQVDVAINIMLSAVIVKFTITKLHGGASSFRRFTYLPGS